MATKKIISTIKKTAVKKTQNKKEEKPSIQEVHRFIANLVRYPFKRIAMGCDSAKLLNGVLKIMNEPQEKALGTGSFGWDLIKTCPRFVRTELRTKLFIKRKNQGILESFSNLAEFRGPVSKTTVEVKTNLFDKDDTDLCMYMVTTCSLGNTYLDDNEPRAMLKATITFIYNVMYANMYCSDAVAFFAYDYLQKFFVTDEKKELAR